MQIITNGHEFLHAVQLDVPNGAAEQLARTGRKGLAYGPVRDSVAPGMTTQWWGQFAKGELLQIEVQNGQTRGLTVEILDQDFRRLAHRGCASSATRLEVLVERPGIHYVRLRHAGEREGGFVLRVLQITPAKPRHRQHAVRSSIVSGLVRILRPFHPGAARKLA
jgi:hypothetical protein